MTDYVIRTKDNAIYFGDYEEAFDADDLKRASITCVVAESGDRWVEKTPYTGRERSFDFSSLDARVDAALQNRAAYLAQHKAEELGA